MTPNDVDPDALEPEPFPIDGTLDLHTFAPRDVKSLVPEYLAECRARGILSVRIVHGKGTGTLRRVVHAALERLPEVAEFRLAGGDGGSWGATLVTLHPSPSGDDLARYYHQRASTYDAVYERSEPERLAELQALTEATAALTRDRRVLELACGTGHWTAAAAPYAEDLVAADIAPGMLAETRRRLGNSQKLVQADAFLPPFLPGVFTAGFAHFLFSHLPRARQAEFLDSFHSVLEPGSPVLLADNVDVPGVGGERVRPPGSPDDFKRRELDGREFLVLKNYFDPTELKQIFGRHGDDVRVVYGSYYWWVAYRRR